jgi:hypothetical protein
LDFDLRLIVSPIEIYNGLSYGDWASIWCSWLFSDQDQTGSVYFLRGNLDNESEVVRMNKNSLTVFSDLAIFFPIICTISCRLLASNKLTQMMRRNDSTKQELNPEVLRLRINDTEIQNLRKYYVESTEFMLEVSTNSALRSYFRRNTRSGKSEAVTAGYWVLIRPLPVGKYRIKFQGQHRDGFKTSGDYTINIVKR